MPAAASISQMTERIRIDRSDAPTVTVSSLTRSGTTATATTTTAHGYATGDFVTIAGAVQAAYNGKFKITVTGATTFTYTVAVTPATPATGAVTAVYASDAQGGVRVVWRTLDTIWAELIPALPFRAQEQLKAQAVGSQLDVMFRVYVRHDITPKMRISWTPHWPKGATARTFEIKGLVPDGRGDTFLLLVCGELR